MNFLLSYNNTYTMEFHAEGGLDDALERAVGALNNEEFFSLVFWARPAGKTIEEVDLDNDCTDYMQCAGPFESKYIVELRRTEGVASRQYAVGHSEHRAGRTHPVSFRYDGIEMEVQVNELMTMPEVVSLLREYYHSMEADPSYALRPIGVGSSSS